MCFWLRRGRKINDPLIWMGFNCLKARATSGKQFIFYHYDPTNSWYSLYRPQEDKRLSWSWSYPVVLNTGPLDWESSTIIKGWQIPNAEQLLYQTEKSSQWRFFIKTLLLKILQYSQENICEKFLRTPFLKKILVRLLLNWLYKVIVWNFVSGLHLKPSWLSSITKIPVTFKPKL